MQSHKDLNVWKHAIDLAEDIYTATREYPKDELFAMVSQMRRAVTSISLNIAEGYGRSTQIKRQFAFCILHQGRLLS